MSMPNVDTTAASVVCAAGVILREELPRGWHFTLIAFPMPFTERSIPLVSSNVPPEHLVATFRAVGENLARKMDGAT